MNAKTVNWLRTLVVATIFVTLLNGCLKAELGENLPESITTSETTVSPTPEPSPEPTASASPETTASPEPTASASPAATLATDATLSALTLSSGTLSPSFASGTATYTASVVNGTASITLTPTRAESHATITAGIHGSTMTAVTSGSPSGSIALSVGANVIDVAVTAQDGTTTQTYAVTVTRSASGFNVTYHDQWGTTGSVPADANGYANGDPVTVAGANTLTKPGYVFLNWNTINSGGFSYVNGLLQLSGGTSYAAASTLTITANTDLYSRWQIASKFRAVYSANGSTGGTLPAADTNLYAIGDLVTVKANTGNLTATGYTFGGWDYNSTTYQPGDTVAMSSSKITFYPRWNFIARPVQGAVSGATGALALGIRYSYGNTTETLNLSGDGNFSSAHWFGTAGDDYYIYVMTPPFGQSCNVTYNTGIFSTTTENFARVVCASAPPLDVSWTPQWTHLAHYYRLNEPVWNGTAGEVLDSIGGAHGSTANAAVTAADAHVGNYAAKFGDGRLAYLPAMGSYATSSYALWAKFNGLTGRFQYLLDSAWSAQYAGYNLQFSQYLNSLSINNPSLNIVTAMHHKDEWYHFAATMSGTTEIFYINGVAVGSIARSGATAWNAPQYLGRSSASGCDGNSGCVGNVSMNDFAVWDTDLTASEVLSLYTNQQGPVFAASTDAFLTDFPIYDDHSNLLSGSPNFWRGQFTYRMNISCEVATVALSATPHADSGSTLQWRYKNGNGAWSAYSTIAATAFSPAIPVSAGSNTVQVLVTAADTSITQTYEWQVTKATSDINCDIGGYWHMNETSGAVLADSSPSQNDLTLFGSATMAVTGHGGGYAVSFPGTLSNDYKSYLWSASAKLNSAYATVSAWVYPTAWPSAITRIAGHSNNGNASNTYDKVIYIGADGKPYFFAFDHNSTPTSSALPTNALPLNQWSHLVGLVSSTKNQMYVNGVKVGETNSAGGWPYYGDPNIVIGGTDGTATETFAGKIDDVGIWSRALSADEITDIYTNGYSP